jgi:hypothetical protein
MRDSEAPTPSIAASSSFSWAARAAGARCLSALPSTAKS